ncbi:hypothetical protein G7Y79_00062g093280 [Physcia stellaris]|nr:hypothetical protein G7Y79_00062g093280 [Physcia stellaris]
MPHSPYQKTITFHAPIHDLPAYHRDLKIYRVYWDKGEEDGFQDLMDDAETLLKNCDFLEEKLRLETFKTMELTRSNKELTKSNEEFQRTIEELKEESRIQREEAEKLMSQLDDARSKMPGTKENIDSAGDEVLGRQPSNSLETRKRSAEDDSAVNGQPVKKGKMEEGDGV